MAVTDPEAVDSGLKVRAMDEAPVGITITDPERPDNPLIYANESFQRVTGYPVEDVLGRNCRFLQGERTDAEAVATIREGIEAAEPVTVELLNYRRDGEPFWNEVTVAPLRDAAGAVTHYVGFQVDVTARKEAQLALASERERLDRLVDRINGLLADVTELLMQGVDRERTERAIVERIVNLDHPSHRSAAKRPPKPRRRIATPGPQIGHRGAWVPARTESEIEVTGSLECSPCSKRKRTTRGSETRKTRTWLRMVVRWTADSSEEDVRPLVKLTLSVQSSIGSESAVTTAENVRR